MIPKRPIIVVDAGIPGAEESLAPLGEVRAVAAEKLSADRLRDATAVVVRSVTRVDDALLDGTPVRWVGTATAGTDHVDRRALRRRGIRFASAPGANAESVGDWVLSALLELALRRKTPLRGLVAGVVGVGQVGRRLVPRLAALGLTVWQNDPPRQRRAERAGRSHPFVPFSVVVERCDILTLHVPLVREGPDRTVALVDGAVLDRMRPGSWLLNASRGSVVDGRALLAALGRGAGPSAVALDTWEGEPRPDPALVARVDLATPHVAGYAIDSKIEANRHMARALARFLGVPAPPPPPGSRTVPVVLAPPPPGDPGDPVAVERRLAGLARHAYPIVEDDRRMRAALPDGFEGLRTGYPERRLFSRYGVRLGPEDPLRGLAERALRMRRVG